MVNENIMGEVFNSTESSGFVGLTWFDAGVRNIYTKNKVFHFCSPKFQSCVLHYLNIILFVKEVFCGSAFLSSNHWHDSYPDAFESCLFQNTHIFCLIISRKQT